MILIADSGSTKTEWQLIANGKPYKNFRTSGINPYYQQKEDIINRLQTELIPQINPLSVNKVFFYGAGCGSEQQKNIITNTLSAFFAESDISVNSDILGASRALFGKEKGIVCILGTGSGSCYYDGKNITEQIPSLGFILGDEGSGAWIGKKMITDYLRGDMPLQCIDIIKSEFDINKENILKQVNHGSLPGTYLAQFARFISNHTYNSYFFRLIYDSFAMFAEKYIIRYKNYENKTCGFVGSVAFHNRVVLKNVSEYYGFRISRLLKAPMEGLIKYHNTD
ncbi:MAG: N-acetylglucosamine kinase [Chlorobi bacterium]|nr:N-acetylglucosamine kinase [Chlorobiota bacterium]